MEERLWWIALYLVPGVGSALFRRLIEKFKSPEKVFSASRGDIEGVEGASKEVALQIKSFDIKSHLKRELELVEEHNISIVTLKDREYPENLKTIFDPPPLLYVRGELKREDDVSVAIVGTRSPTRYGKLTAESLASQLSSRGFTIISGMARGIDSFAHEGALSSGGRTIAVFGSGLDVIYPPENKELMKKIIENGAVLSEFPMGTGPLRKNFPVRNRVISGISLGTVVVEAASRSGSLITARSALDQGREVFAVPGNISSDKSRGTNSLLKWGAKLVEGVDDIIEELKTQTDHSPKKREKGIKDDDQKRVSFCKERLSEEEEKVYSLIGEGGKHIDSIIRESALLPNRAVSILAQLELKGLVTQYSGKMFFKNH